jgi:hypothetical protein
MNNKSAQIWTKKEIRTAGKQSPQDICKRNNHYEIATVLQISRPTILGYTKGLDRDNA